MFSPSLDLVACSGNRRRLGERVDLFLPAELRGGRPAPVAARAAATVPAPELRFSDDGVAWLRHLLSHLGFPGKHRHHPRHRRPPVRRALRAHERDTDDSQSFPGVELLHPWVQDSQWLLPFVQVPGLLS